MSKTISKQSRFHRDPSRAATLQIQERDLAVVRQVMEDRFLSAQQITALFFPSYRRAAERLQFLWNAGYLKREYAPVSFGTSPAIYCLTAKGRELVVEYGGVSREQMRWHKDTNRGTGPFKRHELDLTDVKVGLTVAARKRLDVELHHFGKGSAYYDKVTNAQPDAGEKEHIPIRPDAFIVLRVGRRYHYFFLEVDRGTMALKRLRTKLKGYRAYYFGGGFFAKYGQTGQRQEDYSFRVLMTCPTEETRNNRLEVAAALGSNTMCWFAVQEETVRDPFGSVWVRGKEYKEALKQQKVAQEVVERWGRAKNKAERDGFMRQRVPGLSIL